jgi:hypothetical protein
MTSFSSILRSVRHTSSIGLCILLLAINSAGTAVAQDEQPPESSQDSQDSAPTAIIETRTKSYVVEGLIFAALCGVALFAVCRSSPRGN